MESSAICCTFIQKSLDFFHPGRNFLTRQLSPRPVPILQSSFDAAFIHFSQMSVLLLNPHKIFAWSYGFFFPPKLNFSMFKNILQSISCSLIEVLLSCDTKALLSSRSHNVLFVKKGQKSREISFQLTHLALSAS